MNAPATTKEPNPNSIAREEALKFLYQCEAERIYHFSDGHFEAFAAHEELTGPVKVKTKALVRGTLEQLEQLDTSLDEASSNWRIARMGSIDRNVLRLASFELLESDTPPKVVLNEAIELAKKYGTKDSASFVNGILDRIKGK